MIELAPVGDGLYRRAFAGDTFNTIWHMAQLLGDNARCSFISRIGEDNLSREFASEVSESGLDAKGLGRDPQHTMGLYLIEREGVERRFHYWRQNSAARHLADDPVQLLENLQGCDFIHLSGITLAILAPAARDTLLEALWACRERGAIVSFDPNYRPRLWSSTSEAKSAITKMLSVTGIALPSFDDEQSLWGDVSPEATVNRIAGHGVREIVVKNGSQPVHYSSPELGTAQCDTPAVDGIRDTTGAGDAFNAGYLAARSLCASAADAVRGGQILSALVLQHFGARAPKSEIHELRQGFMQLCRCQST